MSQFADILAKLARGHDLTLGEARHAFEQITSGNATDAQIGALLMGLACKGAGVDELTGAAMVMREKSVAINTGGGDVLDTCGTGGDVRHTFNISTAAALIAAACGVKIVKHGNRSASGRSGSADVLEKLGVRLDLPPEKLRQCLDGCNICFAFARTFHPAMKFVAAARQSMGIPTIFNLLGPLTNPGGAKLHLLGVFAPEWTERLALVLGELGSRRAWVVHAADGLDEISTMGRTQISELKDGSVRTWTLNAADLGLPQARLSDLQVANVDEAAVALNEILAGKAGPRRDIAVLNAAAALVIAGRADDLPSALIFAGNALDSGAALRTLNALRDGSQK
jgi:anthranilate phosphoribosyltransferase